MEKFAVEEVEPPKTASSDQPAKCPACGSTLLPQADTGILLCPKCGSKPFEPLR